MTLLDELKRAKARRSAAKKKTKKKASKKKRRKKAAKKRSPKRRKKAKKRAPKRAPKRRKKAAKKRASKHVPSFGALMKRGGKRKLNVAKTRTRIKNLYKQGELAQANKLRAKLKAAGYEYKA